MKHQNKQIHNSNKLIKIKIRNIENIQSKNVLDCYCGKSGEMYQAVWHKAKKYFGIDQEPHILAKTLKMNNEKAIRLINLSDYNVIDLDAFSDPYKLFEYILKNKKEDFDCILTDGMLRRYDNAKHINKLIGFNSPLLRKFQIDVIKKIISKLTKNNGWTVNKFHYIKLKKNALSQMVYIKLKLKKMA